MESIFEPAHPLTNSRYNRQLLIPSVGIHGQELISQAKVLIIGLGGLGSPAALYLAGSGIHTLGLLDHDVVETSNLHRQIVHRETSVGIDSRDSLTKVASALRGCQQLNSDVQYVPYETRLQGSNALQVIAGYDIVLDCTDNPATRYLINDCCVLLRKTFVSGAAQRLEGQLMVLNYGVTPDLSNGDTQNGPVDSSRGPCYRCVFPVPPSPGMVKGCSEIGILGPVVGAIGTLMASETLKLICQPGQARKPTMLLYNAWSADPRSVFRVIGLRGRRDDCVACGSDAVLQGKSKQKLEEAMIRGGSLDYEAFCGKTENVKLLQDCDRVSARTFLDKVNDKTTFPGLIVDVREPLEIELGPKLRGSIIIPISKWHTMAGNSDVEHEMPALDQVWESKEGPIYLVCQQGNDSQIAAVKLKEMWQSRTRTLDVHNSSMPWIGDVKGGLNAIERLAGADRSAAQSSDLPEQKPQP